MVSIENLENDLKNNKLNGIYLLYGPETFLLENNLKKMKKIFGDKIQGINYINIDDTNVGQLIADIETPAFGYPKKMIIAKSTGLFKPEGKRENSELSKLKENISVYLKENIEIIKESVVLIFIEDTVDTRLKTTKTISQIGTVCEFQQQKPFEVEKRLKMICNGFKVNIDTQTLRYFVECTGTNLQESINEIRKLIEYAGENGTITKEAVDLLTIKKLETIIFDLTDSLGNKKIKTALEVLKNLIYSKEPIQKILITLYNHFKRLYLTKIALKNRKDIIESLNLKPNQTFLVNKYKTQARYFKEEELKEILQKLRDLDYEYKNGKIDLQLGLESILCRYCS